MLVFGVPASRLQDLRPRLRGPDRILGLRILRVWGLALLGVSWLGLCACACREFCVRLGSARHMQTVSTRGGWLLGGSEQGGWFRVQGQGVGFRVRILSKPYISLNLSGKASGGVVQRRVVREPIGTFAWAHNAEP